MPFVEIAEEQGGLAKEQKAKRVLRYYSTGR
jgi:hypothetical protein